VRIIVDIELDGDGRPTGTARIADQTGVGAFSGNMEFLAVIERLCLHDPQPRNNHTTQEES
jgi:hypothetical protein